VTLSDHRCLGLSKGLFPCGLQLMTSLAIVLDLGAWPIQLSILARITPIIFGSPKALYISSFISYH